MDEEKAESYRALYRVRPLLYHIGDIRLWIPIRQDGVVLWFVYIFLFFIFCYIVPIIAWIVPLDRTLIMLIGPIIAAYYSVKLDPAGKTVPKYLYDLFQFHLRPKWLIKWKVKRFSVQKHRIRFRGSCRSYLRRKTETNGEEWHGSAERLQGKVAGLLFMQLPAFFQVKWLGRANHVRMIPASMKKEFISIPSILSVKKKQSISFSIQEPVTVHIQRQDEAVQWHIKSTKAADKGR